MARPEHFASVAESPPPHSAGFRLTDTRWRAARPMILAAALITFLYLLLATVVIAVDPHNVYRWGANPRIEPDDTPRDMVIDWIDVATKDPSFNTFLVGSSITAMYSPEYLKAILGPETRAVNLSYGGPRPKDRDLVLDRLIDNPSVQHVILTFDWTYMVGPDVANSGFPTFLYDGDITNDLRMVNLPTIRKTFEIMSGKLTYDNPDDAEYQTYVKNMYVKFQRPSEIAKLGRMIERNRKDIDAKSGKDCHSFRSVNEQLIPDVRSLSERGVRVDILFPIESYAFYYVRQNDISPTLLDEQMIARRCLVNAVSDLSGVRVFALDGDPTVAGDLANFREVGHAYDPAILQRFVSAMKTGKDRITRANFATYERDIRNAVKEYRIANSFPIHEN